jgi:hypothetical protein
MDNRPYIAVLTSESILDTIKAGCNVPEAFIKHVKLAPRLNNVTLHNALETLLKVDNMGHRLMIVDDKEQQRSIVKNITNALKGIGVTRESWNLKTKNKADEHINSIIETVFDKSAQPLIKAYIADCRKRYQELVEQGLPNDLAMSSILSEFATKPSSAVSKPATLSAAQEEKLRDGKGK